jgi:hypothetical protein
MLRDVENATIYSSGRCAVWRAGQAENRELGGSRGGSRGFHNLVPEFGCGGHVAISSLQES